MPDTKSEKYTVNINVVWVYFCQLISPSGETNLVLTVSFDLIAKTRNDVKRKITLAPFLWETRLTSNAMTVMSRLLLLLSPKCLVELSECVT